MSDKSIEELLENPEELDSLLDEEKLQGDDRPEEDLLSEDDEPDYNSADNEELEISEDGIEVAEEEQAEDNTETKEVPDEVPSEDGDKVEDTEESVEEVETETELVEPPAEEPTLLSKDFLKDKKASLVYNGVDTPVDGDELIRLAQIGMDADIKGYKPAVKLQKQVEESGITPHDLEVLGKLKAGDVTAFKDLLATTNISLEDAKDNIFDYDQEGIDEMAKSIPTYSGPDHIESFIETVPKEAKDKLVDLSTTLPGITGYIDRIPTLDEDNAVKALDVVFSNVQDGTFEEVAPKAIAKYLKLNPHEKNLLNTNSDYFSEFYNDLIREVDQPIEANSETVDTKTETRTPTRTKATVSEVKEKIQSAKPSNKPVSVSRAGKKEKSVDDILADIESLTEEEYKEKYNLT